MNTKLCFFEIKERDLNKIIEIYPSGVNYTLTLGNGCYCELSPSGKTLYLLAGDNKLIQTFRVNKTIFGLKEEK